TAAPLPLQARLRAAVAAGAASAADAAASAAPAPASASMPAWHAEVDASGPLAELALDARLALDSGAAAQAQARVAPFAAWPLLSLAAQTNDLDLRALAPALPQTRL